MAGDTPKPKKPPLASEPIESFPTVIVDIPQPPSSAVILLVENPAIVAALRAAVGVPEGDITETQLGEFVREAQRLRANQAALQAAGADKIHTLDDAAEMLLKVMQPAHQDKVHDVARENRWPEWVVMCGAVARSADNMELVAGEFDPDWLNNPGGVKPVESAPRCEACGHVIPNAHRGMRWCCNGCASGKGFHGPRKCAVAERLHLPIGLPTEHVNQALQHALRMQQEAQRGLDGAPLGAAKAPTTAWGDDSEPL